MVQQRWGDASTNAARPIGRWKATEVFAYLHKHNLPVHPAYAMSNGGAHDRRWLRVHALGGVTGADRGRSDWEEAYFGDVIHASRTRDMVLPALPTGRQSAVMANTVAAELGLQVTDVHAALDSAVEAGLVGTHQRLGVTRYWRLAEWPPEPRWLLPEPADDTLFG